jgi:cupin fold WbuC family metalloprotein
MAFIKDLSGKSLALKFKNKDLKIISEKNIKFLIKMSKKLSDDARIILHKSKKDKIQTMVNLLVKKKFYKFGYHKKSNELYHILKGKLVIIYKNKKKNKKIILDNKKNYIFKMKKNTIHITYPKDSYCVFHEIREGPFDKNDIYYTGESLFLK